MPENLSEDNKKKKEDIEKNLESKQEIQENNKEEATAKKKITKKRESKKENNLKEEGQKEETKEELKKEKVQKTTPKKRTTNKKKVEETAENSRFADVIVKMEEETKKVQKTRKKEQTEIEENEKKQTEKKSKKSKSREISKKVKDTVTDTKKDTDKDAKTTKKLTKNNKKEIIEDKPKTAKRKIKKDQIQEELETIEKEKKTQATTYKEEIQKTNKKVWKNIMLASVIVAYFTILIMGYINIESSIFLTDLKVFSVTLIAAAIYIFEKAYKLDSGKYTILGIEIMVLAILNLLLLKVYMHYNSKFTSITASMAMLFAIYYVGKAIVIYLKNKKKAKKLKNDIRKISKKFIEK